MFRFAVNYYISVTNIDLQWLDVVYYNLLSIFDYSKSFYYKIHYEFDLAVKDYTFWIIFINNRWLL